MKNNAIWEPEDAETYYELSYVIYVLFSLFLRKTFAQQQNIFMLLQLARRRMKVMKLKYSFEFEQK